MVSVRRPVVKGNRYARGGGNTTSNASGSSTSNSHSSFASWSNLRNVLLFLLAVQVINVVVMKIKTVPSGSNGGLPNSNSGTMADRLQDFQRPGAQMQQQQQQQPGADETGDHRDAVELPGRHADDEDELEPPDPHAINNNNIKLTEEQQRELERKRKEDEEAAAAAAAEALINPNDRVFWKIHGTGPTQLGFLVDFVADRKEEVFRKDAFPPNPDYYDSVGALVSRQLQSQRVDGDNTEIALKPCEYVDVATGRLRHHSICSDPETTLVAYNGAIYSRSICGTSVSPGRVVSIEHESGHGNAEHHHDDQDGGGGDGAGATTSFCGEPAHLFPMDTPPISGNGMPPIQVVEYARDVTDIMSGTFDTSLLEDVTCDVPCQWKSNMRGIDRRIAGTDWSLRQIDADPAVDDRARVERTSYRLNQYYSTTSFKSSIPLSFYSFDLYNLRNSHAIDWETAGNSATYVLDNECQAGSIRRSKWYEAIQRELGTESYGSCHHNQDLGPDETLATPEGRIALFAKNRIALAFEKGAEKDHLTAINFEALMSGAVPAFLGTANADKLLPPNSGIFASNFNSWDKFADAVEDVSENKTLWESYHAWRNDETALVAFERRFNFTRSSPECRTCRWAYAKRYGLGWDHRQQTVQEPHLGRNACLDAFSKTVSKPFREHWVQLGAVTAASTDEVCSNALSDVTLDIDGYTVTRSVMQHDGVTDFMITSVNKDKDHGAKVDLVLRIEAAVQNSEGAYFRYPHSMVTSLRGSLASSAAIQDELVKVTVITNWAAKLSSPSEGVLQIVVHTPTEPNLHPEETKRIRVITEDMNQLHDKLTEYFPSPFCRLMMEDFLDPVQLFYVA